MATPTAKLFGEIRDQSRNSLRRLEKHIDLEDGEAPTDAELALMEQLRRILELSVIVVDGCLDE